MSNQGTSNDRYPGLRSFNEKESHLFFGRKSETAELLSQVVAESVVVLFSKSGIGKSSLLYAGLFPELIKKNYYPIRIRFQLSRTVSPKLTVVENSPLNIFKQQLSQALPTQKKVIFLYDNNRPGLWEEFKAVQLENQSVPVLVFDQFEEFFTYPVPAQKEFLSQLSELVHTQAPNRILNWISSIKITDRSVEQMEWIKQPLVKMVFAIRDDKLSELESVKGYIPLILKNRFRLLPLSRKNSEEAIERPAALDKTLYGFETPKFKFDPGVLQGIVQRLAGIENRATKKFQVDENLAIIDGSQLQKVCGFIEKKIKGMASKQEEILVDKTVIDPDTEVQSIIDNFYSDQLATLGNHEQIAKDIIETTFVAGGSRTFVSQAQMENLTKNYPVLITEMLEARLIKEENIHLGPGYELSHDTLLPSIAKSLEERERRRIEYERNEAEIKWKAELEKNELIEKLKNDAENARDTAVTQKEIAEKALADNEKLLRKNKTRGIIIGGIIFVILIGVIILWQRNKIAAEERQALLEGYYRTAARIDYDNNKHHSAFWSYLIAREQGSKEASEMLDSALFADISSSSMNFDKSNSLTLAIYNDGTGAAWGITTETPQYYGSFKDLYQFDISPNGKFVANIKKDDLLEFFDTKTAKKAMVLEQVGIDSKDFRVKKVSFSPAGNFCIITDTAGLLSLLYLEKPHSNRARTLLETERLLLSNENPGINAITIEFSHDDRYLAYKDKQLNCFVLDLEKGIPFRVEKNVKSFFFSPSKPFIVILKNRSHLKQGQLDSVIITRLDNGKDRRLGSKYGPINVYGKSPARMFSMFNDNGNMVALFASKRLGYVYDYSKDTIIDVAKQYKYTFKSISLYSPGIYSIDAKDTLLINLSNGKIFADSNSYNRLQFSSDGKMLFMINKDKILTILNSADFSKVKMPTSLQGPIQEFVVDANGQRIAFRNADDRKLFTYDFQTNVKDSIVFNTASSISGMGFIDKYLLIVLEDEDTYEQAEFLLSMDLAKKIGDEKITALKKVYSSFKQEVLIKGESNLKKRDRK